MGIQADPILRPRSPHSFIVDNIDLLETWLLRRRWLMCQGVNILERCRFTKSSGQVLILYQSNTLTIAGQHTQRTRAELAELFEEAS